MSSEDACQINLPNLISHCSFTLRANDHQDRVCAETEAWILRGANFSPVHKNNAIGLKAGLLTSMCYPHADYTQLRVCADYLNFLFHLDNLSDDMSIKGIRSTSDLVINSLYNLDFQSSSRVATMTKDYARRMFSTASTGCQQRFIESFDWFFQAVSSQSIDRRDGKIPDLESYIALRRDTSGCKPCWALIEYANDLDIPDEVMDHPIIRSLGEAANDLVTWSNDIFSYDVEQSKGDTHNMIPVIMNQQGLDLQSAVDFVGDLCKRSIDRFQLDREQIPSWNPQIDRDVQIYVDGLQNWIVGSLHWSFITERYFGKKGLQIKASRIVPLSPRRLSSSDTRNDIKSSTDSNSTSSTSSNRGVSVLHAFSNIPTWHQFQSSAGRLSMAFFLIALYPLVWALLLCGSWLTC